MENQSPINPFNSPLPKLEEIANTQPGMHGTPTTSSNGNSDNRASLESSKSPDPQSNESNPTGSDYQMPSRRSWLVFGFVCFLLMLVYIYNSGHANKGLRTKEKLGKELKELHSESISLESQITTPPPNRPLAKDWKERD